MFDFWWESMRRFLNKCCDWWNKYNYYDLRNDSTICKCYKVINPMQTIQYTSNMYYDSNKYTNNIDTHKYVTSCACLCNSGLFLIHNVISFVKVFNKQSKKPNLECVQLQHVTISISTTLLSNTPILGFVSFYK
jgi:hypothetical protein